jgi:GNAT superfamily N-acetyltransferase
VIETRFIQAEDYVEWRNLWDGYNAFYGRVGANALDEEITRVTWQRFFDTDEPMHAVVAVRGQRIIGFAHYLYHRSTTSIALSCYLQDVFVAADARKGGVGRLLIEAVYAHAKLGGASRLYWQTQESNTIARALYDAIAENSGFIVYRKLM